MPLSQCNNVTFRNIQMTCNVFFNVTGSDKYALKDFAFEDIDVKDYAKEKAFSQRPIDNLMLKNVVVNGETIE